MDFWLGFIAALSSLGLLSVGWGLCLWYLRAKTDGALVTGTKRCAECQTALASTAIRCHDGRWLCPTCKGR